MEDHDRMSKRKQEAENFFRALSNPSEDMIVCHELPLTFNRRDLTLFRIDEITFEDEAPQQEALENVLASVRVPGINFVYLILGKKTGVEFYFGLSRDLYSPQQTDIQIAELGENLKASLLGNFRGSQVSEITDGNDLQRIIDRVHKSHDAAFLCGVPGVNKEEEKRSFQGVDRLVNIMQGREFGLMILAKPIFGLECRKLEEALYAIYRRLNLFGKVTIQHGVNDGTSKNTGISRSKTTSSTTSTSESTAQTTGTSDGTSDASSKAKGTNESQTSTDNVTKTNGSSESESVTQGSNTSKSETNGTSKNTSKSEASSNSSSDGSARSSTSTSHSTTKQGGEGTSSSKSTQQGESKSISKQIGKNAGESKSVGTSKAKGSSISTTESTTKTHSSNDSKSVTKSTNQSKATSVAETSQEGTSESKGSSSGDSHEDIDKEALEWMKYFDDVVFPRLDYGKGKGLFTVSTFLFAENPMDLLQLTNNTKSIFAGESGNRVPLERLPVNKTRRNAMNAFQQPFGDVDKASSNDLDVCFMRSHCFLAVRELDKYQMETIDSRMFLGNWMSAKELAILSGIPQREIVGLRLKEEVEFGLNVPTVSCGDDEIPMGRLVQSGVKTSIPVSILKSELDRHIFIAGVTGSGKTTTSKKILLDSGLPFLVIEPAKTEYRSLLESYDDLLVFTLGNDDLGPFRLNPFEFLRGEGITARVDMIKASIEAAFDMEAAIPQIIESAIYKSYEDKGWDITTNENHIYPDEKAFAEGVFAFPRLEEVIRNTKVVIEKEGFDERLKGSYIGSVKARLDGLMLGSKGLMLNCRRSIDFDELLDRHVVIELEGIRSGNEKSLIMGFILTNFLEAVRRRYEHNHRQPHRHILLVEEAHRLLSRYTAGDSLNRKHGVETFADMLAEIRKYGESLIIADQIPNKLTPEVLKNTNTKIVQRIFAKDDKDTIGSMMSLSEEQSGYLSNLQVGNAIMFSGNWPKAIQVSIDYDERTKEVPVDEDKLRAQVYELYASQYKRGLFDYTEYLEAKPDFHTLRECQRIQSTLYKEFQLLIACKAKKVADVENLLGVATKIGYEKALLPLCERKYGENGKDKIEAVKSALETLAAGNVLDPVNFASLGQ